MSEFKLGDVVRLSGQGVMAPFMTIIGLTGPRTGEWDRATCAWFLHSSHYVDGLFPLAALELVDTKEEA